MSVSFWNDRSKDKKTNVDIAIIGGGIAGLSCAYWLNKEDPTLKIAVIEKYELGSGATGRNAGFITCGSVEHFNRLVTKHGLDEALAIWRFSETNLSLLRSEIIQDNEIDFGFEQKGSFSLASTETEFHELKESAQLMLSMGINTEVIHEKGILKRLNAQKFVGGIKYCGDASVHPISLLNGIRKKLSPNVLFLENHEVHAIKSDGPGTVIQTNKTDIEAEVVVLATNGYSALMHPYFQDKIYPTRGQILCTAPYPKFMEGPCYANFVLDYFRQLPTGEVIIGGFRQLQKDVEKGYSDEISPTVQSALETFLKDHLPALKDLKITHRWSGVMGFSADGQPLIGSLPDNPRIFFCGGFTGHGLGLAFHSGKILTDSIFGKTIPRYLSARRF